MTIKPFVALAIAPLVALSAQAELASTATSLTLDSASVYAQPASTEIAPRTNKGDRFGLARADGYDWYLSFAGGAGHNFKKDTDYTLAATFSTFVADNIELGIEPGLWYFAQKGKDTEGVSLSFVARYHWFPTASGNTSRARDWSLFGELGIGVLYAFADTPVGGSHLNFLPRVGGGVTVPIDNSGTRLFISARWHHVSNARISGNNGNPSRNGVLFTVGVEMPWPW
jgi:hypothetical protein